MEKKLSEKKIAVMQQEREKKELVGCTFHPTIFTRPGTSQELYRHRSEIEREEDVKEDKANCSVKEEEKVALE